MDTGTTVCLLAESDIWSELFSLLVIFLVAGVPAIIRSLAEKGKNSQQKDRESGKLRHTGPAKPKRGSGAAVSEWDRRQELIRERLKQLQERQSSVYKPAVKAEPPQQRPVTADIPVSRGPAEKPSIPTLIPATSGIPEYTKAMDTQTPLQYMETPAAIKVPVTKPPAQKKTLQGQSKRIGGASVIEKLIYTTSPLKAGIILKEILDSPKAFKVDLDAY